LTEARAEFAIDLHFPKGHLPRQHKIATTISDIVFQERTGGSLAVTSRAHK